MVKGPTVEWLINNHKLADYDYKSVVLADESKLKKSSTGDFTKQSMDKAIPKAIYGDIVGNYKKYANGQKLFFTHIVLEASKISQNNLEMLVFTQNMLMLKQVRLKEMKL